MLFSIVTTRRFALWWRLAKSWFTGQFNDVKEEIIAAVEGIDPYVALSESELDGITSDEDLNTNANE